MHKYHERVSARHTLLHVRVLCQSILRRPRVESAACVFETFPNSAHTRKHQKIALDVTTLSPLLALGTSAGEQNAEFILFALYL
jgi:hypothetical protein